MLLKFKQVLCLTLGWTTLSLLSPSMPFGAISSSLAQEPPLSYPPFTRECTETEIRQYETEITQYVEYSVNSEFARLALIACRALGKEAKASVPNLMEALDYHPDWQVRSSAAEALGEIGKEPQEAVPVLIEALKKDDLVNYDYITWALVHFGKAAVPALVEALKDKREEVRSRAVFSLVLIGKNAEAAVPALKVALKDENSQIRVRAAVTLAEINPAYTQGKRKKNIEKMC